MQRKAGTLLMAIGMIVVAIAIFQYIEHQVKMKQALAKAEALVESSPLKDASETKPSASSVAASESLSERPKFSPKENDVIGTLHIPKIEAELPIIEGTEEEMLQQGVGHYLTSAFPSDGEQIVLSGHRDTVFRDFAKLELGDRFIVKMPYGTFHYEISSTEIVDQDDTSVIRSMGEEVLVVTTCYPFRYVGDAPERYIVYALPVLDGENS